MKHIHTSVIVNIFLLTTILVGFSVESRAAFYCYICNTLYNDDSEKAIEYGAGRCKKCIEECKSIIHSVYVSGMNKGDDSISEKTVTEPTSKKDCSPEPSEHLLKEMFPPPFNNDLSEQSPTETKNYPERKHIADPFLMRRMSSTDSSDYESDTPIRESSVITKFTTPLGITDFDLFLSAAMGKFESNTEQFLYWPNIKHAVLIDENDIRDMLHNAENTEVGCTAKNNLLPDFITTYNRSTQEPDLLFERKTSESANILTHQRNNNLHLYIVIKSNNVNDCSQKPIYYRLAVKTNSISDGEVYFFTEILNGQLRKIPACNLPEIITLCEKWAVYHNKIIGIYEVTKYDPTYMTNYNHKEIGFDEDSLKNSVHKISITNNLENSASKVTTINSGSVLRHLRTDSSLSERKEIKKPFIEWYKQEWINNESYYQYLIKDRKHFIIELIGVTARGMSNPMIIVTQLNENYYGINLLEGISDAYLVLVKECMDKFAKQLMWTAKRIEISEIKLSKS